MPITSTSRPIEAVHPTGGSTASSRQENHDTGRSSSLGDSDTLAEGPRPDSPTEKPERNMNADRESQDPGSATGGPGGDTFPPLAKSNTVKTSSSAVEAARILAEFSTHPANPRNWTRSRKWRTTLVVAVTGFISTCGSSIGVPGIHAVMEDFGETNEKLAVLITAFYVLGLG